MRSKHHLTDPLWTNYTAHSVFSTVNIMVSGLETQPVRFSFSLFIGVRTNRRPNLLAFVKRMACGSAKPERAGIFLRKTLSGIYQQILAVWHRGHGARRQWCLHYEKHSCFDIHSTSQAECSGFKPLTFTSSASFSRGYGRTNRHVLCAAMMTLYYRGFQTAADLVTQTSASAHLCSQCWALVKLSIYF